jgi:hypothetical protein
MVATIQAMMDMESSPETRVQQQDQAGLADRVRRIEDRAELQDLGVLYGFVMDERDLDGVRAIFCEDATLRTPDGVFDAVGIEQIVASYSGRYDVLGATNHVSHGHLLRPDPRGQDWAQGLLTSHAEVVRHGVAKVVALRYEDTYHRVAGRWRFHDRLMSYLYYLPVEEYAAGLGSDRPQRADAGEPRTADFPWVLHGEPGRLAPWWGE